MGTILATLCGAIQPFFLYFFGKITGDIVEYVAVVSTPNITDSELQQAIDTLQYETNIFAISLAAVGIAMLLSTYIGNTLFSYSALRQVGKSVIHIKQLSKVVKLSMVEHFENSNSERMYFSLNCR